MHGLIFDPLPTIFCVFIFVDLFLKTGVCRNKKSRYQSIWTRFQYPIKYLIVFHKCSDKQTYSQCEQSNVRLNCVPFLYFYTLHFANVIFLVFYTAVNFEPLFNQMEGHVLNLLIALQKQAKHYRRFQNFRILTCNYTLPLKIYQPISV